MDPELKKAYADLENDIRDAFREHHGNASVISTAMNALLLYPDRPFGLGTLYGFCTNPDSGNWAVRTCRFRFCITKSSFLSAARRFQWAEALGGFYST